MPPPKNPQAPAQTGDINKSQPPSVGANDGGDSDADNGSNGSNASGEGESEGNNNSATSIPQDTIPDLIGCTATFDCSDAAALAAGVYGLEIMNSVNNLYSPLSGDGVTMCGSVKFNNTCSVVLDACQGNACLLSTTSSLQSSLSKLS